MVNIHSPEYQELQTIANQFGILDINTVRIPEHIFKMFYKVNPNLVPIERAASTSALASTSTSVPQSNQPPQTPAFAPLPESHITVNEPIVVSDSSDEEDDGYDTAPSSPTMGASELEITRNKLEFYKQLFLEASGKLKNLSNHRRPAKDKNHHDKHHHQHHRTGHHHMTTRSERRTEARARREQHELIRTHILSNAGQPRQYVSQETQVRHANTERLPQLRQSLLQGESSDENDDSGSYREYPARRDILKFRKRSAARPPPDVREHHESRPIPVMSPQPPTIITPQRRIQPTLVRPFITSFTNNNPERNAMPGSINNNTDRRVMSGSTNNNTGRNVMPSFSNNNTERNAMPSSINNNTARNVMPIFNNNNTDRRVMSGSTNNNTARNAMPLFNNNKTEKKHPLHYRPLYQTLGVHTENHDTGPNQANNAAQAPICPAEASGLNCIERTCRYSHCRDFT